jgi:GDP-D-mannose 3',5'-epimerase
MVDKDQLVVVCGGGGFIGGHMVAKYRNEGYTNIRSVDIKPFDEWEQLFDDVENLQLDLRLRDNCYTAADGAAEIVMLAADMGGMGFIETHKAECMLSVLISTHMLLAARDSGCKRYFYSSSACVYNADKQDSPDVAPLKEADAYPAMAEDGYGWEKLFTERMCRHFREDFGMETRVARFHNVYGPHGTWEGGREKAPAAICRKIIHAKHTGDLDMEIWGDGTRTRSFMYIDDCTHGIRTLTDSDVLEPLNLGSKELVTINGLVDIVEEIAGIKVNRQYDLSKPQGVHGRNSDNTLIQKHFGWEPSISLKEGMAKTYAWIEQEYMAKYGATASA